MDDVALARVLHVVAVVFWIGGVAMVTTVLLPAVRRFKEPAERVAFFETVERRFAGQAPSIGTETTIVASGTSATIMPK